MRCLILFAALFLYHYSFAQTLHGRLYFFTVPGGAIPAYLGYVEYPGETHEAIDSFMFDQFVDITMIDDKLFTAKLEDVTGYDTVDHVPTDTVTDVYAQHIAGWNGRLVAISFAIPYFRVYDIPSDSLVFSLDTSRVPDMPMDLAVWDDKAFVLMTNSMVIVDLIARDTIATIATPHPYLNQDQNIFIVDAGDDFYIGVGYATGAIRSSLLRMNKTSYQVETVFHNEGYAIEKPVVAGDRIYFGAFDTHYSIADDSLYVSNNSEPFPLAYDAESASLFLYQYTPNGIHYFTGGVFSDTLFAPYYLSQALFEPAAIPDPCDSFSVTGIEMDSTDTYLLITIFLEGDSTRFINYPYVSLVTGTSGDTTATGNLNFFGQFGGTSQTYGVSTTLGAAAVDLSCTIHFQYDTSVCIFSNPCLTNGIEINYLPDFPVIYPNPSDGNITIRNKGEDCRLEVYNVQGKRIHAVFLFQTPGKMNLSHFTPGIYFLKILDGEKVYSEKIVIR